MWHTRTTRALRSLPYLNWSTRVQKQLNCGDTAASSRKGEVRDTPILIRQEINGTAQEQQLYPKVKEDIHMCKTLNSPEHEVTCKVMKSCEQYLPTTFSLGATLPSRWEMQPFHVCILIWHSLEHSFRPRFTFQWREVISYDKFQIDSLWENS